MLDWPKRESWGYDWLIRRDSTGINEGHVLLATGIAEFDRTIPSVEIGQIGSLGDLSEADWK